MALDEATQKRLKAEWDKLWGEAQVKRGALEGGIRGGVSTERRRDLENEYSAAHKRWWDAVSNFKP
jgi:hypothetical protein